MTVPAALRPARAVRRRALLLGLGGLLLAQIVLGLLALGTLSGLPRASSGLLGSPGLLRDQSTLRREGGYRVLVVQPGSPAAAAGLLAGDLITRCEDLVVSDQPESWYRALRLMPPEGHLRLVWVRAVRSQQGELRFHAPTAQDRPSALRAWLIYGPLLLPPLLLLAVGALVGLLRPLDDSAWAVSLAFLCLGQSTSLLLDHTPLLGILPLPLMLAQLALSRLALYPLAHFSVVLLSRFPSESRLGRRLARWRWLLTLPFALLAVDGLLDSLVLGGAIRPLGAFGALLEALAQWELLISLLVALCLALLASQRGSATATAQRRRGIIEVGILAACAGTLWAVLVWKSAWHRGLVAADGGSSAVWLLSWLAPMLLYSLLPAAFAYAVLARRVFGIRLIVRRGLQHLLLSRSVLVAEAIVVFLILDSLLRLEASRTGGTAAAALITLAAIGGIGRLNRPLLRRIDRRFFRERYDARRLLLGLGQRFGALARKGQILDETTAVIGQALQVERTCCFGRDLHEGQPTWRLLSRFPTHAAPARAPAPPLSALESLCRAQPIVDPPGGAATGEPAQASDFELLVAIPGTDQLAGCLALAAKRSGEPFGQEDRTLLGTVAGQLGLALENLALLEVARREARQARELEIARQVQQRLFPAQLPEAPGWQLAALCRPAQEVGGDYYDAFWTQDGRVALAIGDVAGKGVGPALVMSSIQALIRDRLQRGSVELPLLARILNQHLLAFTGPSTFITLFVALLEPASGRLHYINCGHNPPLLLPPQAPAPLSLHVGGSILGLLPQLEFTSAEASLPRASRLLLYSDGVTEATAPDGAQFGEARLVQLLRPPAPTSDRLLASILDAVDTFAGPQPQSDDISLLCLRRL